jgi:hypothetical protein
LNSKAHNLTGVWHGYYGYPGAELTVDFMATLLEAGSQFSGSISEPAILDDAAGDTLFAIVSGGREGGTVSFEKTYEGDSPNYNIVRYRWAPASDAQPCKQLLLLSQSMLIGSRHNQNRCDGHASRKQFRGTGRTADQVALVYECGQ